MQLRAGPGILTDHALDSFIAPQLSKLGRPEIQSLATLDEAAANWLPDFLLNQLLRFAIDPRDRQFRLALVRRTAAGISDYELGRVALDQYLRGPRQRIGPYFSALRYFEAATAATYQALCLGAASLTPKEQLFEKHEKTAEFGRLSRVYAHSKHADDMFDSKQVDRDLTLTVWLTNSGLTCVEATVTYADLADMLGMLARIAGAIVNPGGPP